MEGRDLSRERELACVPIAMSILRVLASEENLFMGQQDKDAIDAYFKKLFQEKVEPILRTADLKLADMAFIFQLIMQPIQNVQTITVDTMNQAFDTVVAYKLQQPDVSNVRISDLIRVQNEASAALSTATSGEGSVKE